MSLAIHKKDLADLFRDLSGKWPVYGPTENKEAVTSRFRFAKLSSFKNFAFNYGHTVLPPKQFFLPPEEVLFRFGDNKISPPEETEIILFGLNRKDGEGIFYLDKIMSEPIIDEKYQIRRQNIKIIIIDSLPPSNSLNCDLYLQRVDKDHYLAFPYSPFGEEIAQNPYFGHEGDVGTISTRHAADEVIYHPRLDKIVENSYNHPIWDKLADTCFNCGICSYVCPLCYCFKVEDQIDITKNVENDCQGCRNRSWDSCMLPDFAKVTFHNFRPELKDRIYNWYYHKFVRMPREYGIPGCIDCGRCITYCPANINYRDVLKELIKDEKNTK
ncbi:MAG: 4Fe-4S dicluster domain-containing protein [Patescibacteria group bacterium]|jgi:sulfhydrogenase subunit beta (sulfur reductase)|nr:4Fe-4S dicluster domain-containing protein [Patescibacteria group bacterium]